MKRNGKMDNVIREDGYEKERTRRGFRVVNENENERKQRKYRDEKNRTLKDRLPIVRRHPPALRVVPRRSPEVPIALRVGPAAPGFEEPFVLYSRE